MKNCLTQLRVKEIHQKKKNRRWARYRIIFIQNSRFYTDYFISLALGFTPLQSLQPFIALILLFAIRLSSRSNNDNVHKNTANILRFSYVSDSLLKTLYEFVHLMFATHISKLFKIPL